MPARRIGKYLTYRRHDDHGDGERSIHDGDDDGHMLGRGQLGDKRYAYGEQCTRHRADENSRRKKHSIALGRGR